MSRFTRRRLVLFALIPALLLGSSLPAALAAVTLSRVAHHNASALPAARPRGAAQANGTGVTGNVGSSKAIVSPTAPVLPASPIASPMAPVLPAASTVTTPGKGVAATPVPLPATSGRGGDGSAGALASYRGMPLNFESNVGQTDGRVKFLARGAGYTLFLTGNEAVLALVKQQPQAAQAHLEDQGSSAPTTAIQENVLRMRYVGANAAPQISAISPLSSTANYFGGANAKTWHTDVPTYARIVYKNVYPGVDLVYHGSQGHLEYDWTLAPGANPQTIALAVDGAQEVRVDAHGDLVMQVGNSEVHQGLPTIYQEPGTAGASKHAVAGHYVLKGANQVGFAVGAYDTTKPLVIDPVLGYSTFLGGSGDSDTEGYKVAVDSAGSAYITGQTTAPNFPATTGANTTTYRGGYDDTFVTKLNAGGSAPVYSTYLGGSDDDVAWGIAADSAGNAYVAGKTASTDFPTTSNASQRTYGGGAYDAFLTK